jgi:hypothetical protein
MVAGVLFLMLVLLTLLLVAFIYQIVTTPLTAVDAPTLVRSAAARSAHAPALPVRRPRRAAVPAATGPAHATAVPGASRRLRSWIVAALAMAGLAAVLFGGWLFLHIAPGAAACSHPAFEVCSQGFVLLTGTQLAGGAIAGVGMGAIVVASVLALR